jgi:hypothetical protein
MMTNARRYDWDNDVAPYLAEMTAVKGGFTPAKRGVVTLHDGTKVFVKIAVDALTEKWLKKEIKVYTILNKAGYDYMPKLLAVNDSNSAMAIEYLDGATFDDHWDQNKIDAVNEAQMALTKYKQLFEDDDDFYFYDADKVEQRWQNILTQKSIDIINTKFTTFGVNAKFSLEQLLELRSTQDGWSMKKNTLIHEDIRADNFGYFESENKGKLVDWNWLVIGDKKLDDTSVFVHTYAAGFDPYVLCPEKYDAKTLAYRVCFWLDSILGGNENASEREYRLRSSQALSVKACIELIKRGPIR